MRVHNAGESSAHDVVIVAPIPEHAELRRRIGPRERSRNRTRTRRCIRSRLRAGHDAHASRRRNRDSDLSHPHRRAARRRHRRRRACFRSVARDCGIRFGAGIADRAFVAQTFKATRRRCASNRLTQARPGEPPHVHAQRVQRRHRRGRKRDGRPSSCPMRSSRCAARRRSTAGRCASAAKIRCISNSVRSMPVQPSYFARKRPSPRRSPTPSRCRLPPFCRGNRREKTGPRRYECRAIVRSEPCVARSIATRYAARAARR